VEPIEYGFETVQDDYPTLPLVPDSSPGVFGLVFGLVSFFCFVLVNFDPRRWFLGGKRKKQTKF